MWIVWTTIIVLAVAGLVTLIVLRPVVGFIALLLVALFAMVGSTLHAYFAEIGTKGLNRNDLIRPLTERDLRNSQRLLRYCTAVLSFLSLYSTAAGMQSFVFVDADWLAYMGSFAVQGILVVFSFLLCRFFVQISILDWPVYFKRLASNLLILFFSTSLVMSSSFSYSFIANNAYKRSWLSDCETVIQRELLSATYLLRDENERRGTIILDDISSTATERLKNIVSTAQNVNDAAQEQELRDYLSVFSMEKVADVYSVRLSDGFRSQLFSDYPEEASTIIPTYESVYSAYYTEAAQKYNGMIDEISGWKDIVDLEALGITIEQYINSIGLTSGELFTRVNNIDNLRTPYIYRTFTPTRETFKNVASDLKNSYDQLQSYLEEAKNKLDIIHQSRSNPMSDQFNNLLTQIYLLGIENQEESKEVSADNSEQSASIDSARSDNIRSLAQEITDYAVQASAHRDFEESDARDFVLLRDEMMLYADYLSLAERLNGDTGFIELRLKKTYQIFGQDNGSSQISGHDNEREQSDESAIFDTDVRLISSVEWKEIRNDDFGTFFTLVNDLPDMNLLDRNTSSSTNNMTTYDTVQALDTMSNLQRDLLGELTDFEMAYNYFKYPFPVMAYFSLAIAVYFDLGAFFTGCFLYITEYIEKKEATNSSKNSTNENEDGNNEGGSDEHPEQFNADLGTQPDLEWQHEASEDSADDRFTDGFPSDGINTEYRHFNTENNNHEPQLL